MALLAEYALTPDVFDSASYSSDEVGDIRLQNLKEVLLSEGLVRDLREGRWSALFADDGRSWHMRGKELLKKLAQQKRLRRCACARANDPSTDDEWCDEAVASHNNGWPLTGVITTRSVADNFRGEPLVASIDQLPAARWWSKCSPSIRLARTVDEYKKHLRLVLHCANSIMFIDPHLDPMQQRYHDFLGLLLETQGRMPAPLIEVHRVCYYETRDKRDQRDDAGWKAMFTPWADPLRVAGLAVEVFVWDDFHDRFVISDLVGISLPNGFDTTTDPRSLTRWTRLGRGDRDDVQREFDPASKRHELKHRFRIGYEDTSS